MPGIRAQLVVALTFSALAGIAIAQVKELTIATQVTPRDIESLLASDDPRLMAWGAYFAREKSDDSAVAPMMEIVERWEAPAKGSGSESRARTNAMLEILDAMIQRNRTVSTENLATLSTSFPDQAMVLASRLPMAEATPLLESWYAKRSEPKQTWLPRVAAMMLSKAPPAGFAASVLSESAEYYNVIVVDRDEFGGGTGFGCLGGSSSDPAGWPPIYRYVIDERWTGDNARVVNDPLVVEAGGERIVYRRAVHPENPCPGVRALNEITRQHLLLEMLGGDRTALEWEPREQETLHWAGTSNYLSELGKIVDAEESKLRDTVMALDAKGLLTGDEAATARPRLSVQIVDDRQLKEPKLPRFKSSDARTSVEPYNPWH